MIRSQRSPYGTSLLGAGAVHHIKPGHCRDVLRMTALAPKADFDLRSCDVADVPKPAVFETYDIETLAPERAARPRGAGAAPPDTGCQMLDEFLKSCDKGRMVSRYVTRDEDR